MRIHWASGLFLALAVPAIAPQASHPAVENAKSKSGKVYTDEDLSRLPKDGISVVGQETPSEPASTAAANQTLNRHRVMLRKPQLMMRNIGAAKRARCNTRWIP